MIALLVQTAASWFMVGSIWTMQVLNYPLLDRVGAESFTAYETAHNRRFGVVVGPAVLVVAVTTVLLLVGPPAAVGRLGPTVGAVLLVAIVAMTARWQAPAHARLARGFDPAVHRSLVRGNAVRAVVWTVLGILDVIMVALAA